SLNLCRAIEYGPDYGLGMIVNWRGPGWATTPPMVHVCCHMPTTLDPTIPLSQKRPLASVEPTDPDHPASDTDTKEIGGAPATWNENESPTASVVREPVLLSTI